MKIVGTRVEKRSWKTPASGVRSLARAILSVQGQWHAAVTLTLCLRWERRVVGSHVDPPRGAEENEVSLISLFGYLVKWVTSKILELDL